MMMQQLNAITMPLVGNNLIEASAGTGKTFTITTLYLRALLGLMQKDQSDGGLSVEQILVVTFTEAATEEIRDRVRSKLLAAKEALFYADCEYQDRPAIDETLTAIIAQLPDKTLAFERLDGAIKMMDEAAIFTIHGFCQRMLKYHAFESGSLFDNEFILDEQQYLLSAIKDFWRCTVYPLKGAMLELFLAQWQSPESLLAQIRPLFNKHPHRLEPQIDRQSLEQLVNEYQRLITIVKAQWLQEQIPALINDSNLLKSRKPAKAEYLQAFTDFCCTDELVFSSHNDSWSLWSVESITKVCKKGTKPPQHEIFDHFSRLADTQQQLAYQVKAHFKIEALKVVERNLSAAKSEAQKLSPDDLLTKMVQALSCEKSGSILATRIATSYPLAMIDEFQDTDPLQYEIFKRIYAKTPTTWVLIGDPKQAIYGFRGGDIFTYISAKQAIASSSQYTLDTNWRSSSALIHAVNGLFSHKANAFIYDDVIPFMAVNAANKPAKALTIADDNGAALQMWQLTGENNLPVAKGIAIEQLAYHTSNEIVSLLTKAQQGQALIGDKPLQAGDICILVRDRNEAQVMRDTLSLAGVSSVFLSRQSVFDTPLAADFYLLLQAIYQQNNEKAIRAALITCFFNNSINQLWQLTENDQDWQQVLSDFAYLHQVWLRHGVMAVLQHLFNQQQLACLWQSEQDFPERMLTDIRHLAELLQQKSLELEGIHRLLNWYQQQMLGAQDEDKVQQLRLEDDSNLVQIVTMHASKGLEYPIVFMPFACHYRPAKSAVFHDHNNHLVIDFSDQPAHVADADKERLAEDLRLLYVALTRGVYRCYVGVSNLKIGNSKSSILAHTSLGHLLFNGGGLSDDEISAQLLALTDKLNQSQSDSAAFCQLPPLLKLQLFTEQVQDEQVYQLAQFTGQIEHDWKVTSYSALCYGVASVEVLPGSTDEGVEHTQSEKLPTQSWDRFSFPKGAASGSCLHEILEKVPFELLSRGDVDEQHRQLINDTLSKYGLNQDWLEPLLQWLADVCNTPWRRGGISLAKLTTKDCVIEMEFYMAMEKIRAEHINQILSEHLGRKITAFDFNPVQGLLKGFIDLTVCFKDKYYVVDHKSNYLGDSMADYVDEALEQAMDRHHYHLQYLLYSLALHRFLTQRLANYDYERHFGGCYYLFLRGMSANNIQTNGIYFSRPKVEIINKLDQLFAGDDNQSHQAEVSPQQLGLFGE